MAKKIKIGLLVVGVIAVICIVIMLAKPKKETTMISVTTEDPNANQPLGVTISSEYSTEE